MKKPKIIAKKVQKGEGGLVSAPKFKKSTIQNVEYSETGGVRIFTFFPNSNDQNMHLILIIYSSYEYKHQGLAPRVFGQNRNLLINFQPFVHGLASISLKFGKF